MASCSGDDDHEQKRETVQTVTGGIEQGGEPLTDYRRCPGQDHREDVRRDPGACAPAARPVLKEAGISRNPPLRSTAPADRLPWTAPRTAARNPSPPFCPCIADPPATHDPLAPMESQTRRKDQFPEVSICPASVRAGGVGCVLVRTGRAG